MTFIENYLKYCEGTEPNIRYHKFSSLSALAAIVGRRAWVEMGRFTLFPNLYIVLVGPSGHRKTAAMSISENLCKKIENIPVSAEATTKEKLVLDIAEQLTTIETLKPKYTEPERYMQSCMNCFLTELTHFLGPNPGHMVDFLTTIYDRDDKYGARVKNSKSGEILAPFLNIIACTTPEHITTYLKENVLTSGFGRRTIFVFANQKGRRITFPEVSSEQQHAMNACIAYAKEVQEKVAGPLEWSDEARAFVDDWYVNLEIPADRFLAGYYESKQGQLIKVATLMSISESTEMKLELRHVEEALSWLDENEKHMFKVYQGIGRNELAGVANIAMNMIEQQPQITLLIGNKTKTFTHGITEKKLKVYMFKEGVKKELDEVIEHILNSNAARTVLHNTGQGVEKWIVMD